LCIHSSSLLLCGPMEPTAAAIAVHVAQAATRTPTPMGIRRRICSKESAPQVCADNILRRSTETAAEVLKVSHPIEASVCIPAQETIPSCEESAVTASVEEDAESVSHDALMESTETDAALPIVDRDARDWWRKAGEIWRNHVHMLQGQAIVGIRIHSMPSSPSKQIVTPNRKRSALETMGEQPTMEAKGLQTDAELLPSHASPSSVRCASSPPPTNRSPRTLKINKKAETCAICCNEVSPWHAAFLRCGHGWYCEHCLEMHAKARLQVGDPSVQCPECRTALAEYDLRKLLPEEVIDRLLDRSLEQAVSSSADLWACPTPNCPMRVAVEDGTNPRFKCTMCKKVSCIRCGAQPFHTGRTCEAHAKKPVAKSKSEEEEALMRWLEETGTKQCPTCRMGITKENLDKQKTQYKECHKMMCWNCSTRFCFKCLTILTPTSSCGCSIDAHGFINPKTGRRLEHLRPTQAKKKARRSAAA